MAEDEFSYAVKYSKVSLLQRFLCWKRSKHGLRQMNGVCECYCGMKRRVQVIDGIRIVCAAMRLDEHIIPSVRHWDKHANKISKVYTPLNFKKAEQGFLDTKGKFYNREDAYKLAVASGQIVKGKWSAKELYSEDLY